MDQLCKLYQTFFLIQMDEEALESFSLPRCLDPADNPARFGKICLVFLLPHDECMMAAERRLPQTLRRQLYRQGTHIHPNEVDVDHPENQMPQNCVLINQQDEQTMAFLLGAIHSKQASFDRTVVFARNPRNLKQRLSFFELCNGSAPNFMLLRELEECGSGVDVSLS